MGRPTGPLSRTSALVARLVISVRIFRLFHVTSRLIQLTSCATFSIRHVPRPLPDLRGRVGRRRQGHLEIPLIASRRSCHSASPLSSVVLSRLVALLTLNLDFFDLITPHPDRFILKIRASTSVSVVDRFKTCPCILTLQYSIFAPLMLSSFISGFACAFAEI